MPTNPYFAHGTENERKLYEDLIIESIQMYGLDVYYLPREIVEKNEILNDEVLSQFGEAYQIEMYIKDVDGFGGEDLLSRFGLSIKDECTFIVAKRRWQELVQTPRNILDQKMPHEGDLVYLPLMKGLFEIRFVEDQEPFFQLGEGFVFELRCELFTYENQKIQTGIDDIDKIPNKHAYIHNAFVELTSGYANFVEEDIVTFIHGNNSFSAQILDIVTTNDGELYRFSHFNYPNKKFIPISAGMEISSESGAEGIITEVIDLNDPRYREYTNDPFGDNDQFQKKLPDLIDWSENNPFGDL